MKKIITTTIIAFVLTNANAQAKKDSVANNDTPLFSVADISRIDSILQKKINKFELVDYNQVFQLMQQLVTGRINQYNSLNKSAAKKP